VRRIVTDGSRAIGVVLDDGRELRARRIISSAGACETVRLYRESTADHPPAVSGQLTFIESISVLDTQPSVLGHPETIVFFNDSPKFHWRKPDGFADLRSGVICSPNNFQYPGAGLDEGVIRITALANYDRWDALNEDEYLRGKTEWYEAMTASAARFMPDFRKHVVEQDMFTPKTIRRFTGHDNGAVYGAPSKRGDGTTDLENLFLCGTDQGFVGIIGTIISGIQVANRHALQA